ncbi:pseudouridine synthase [Sinimarinibacterium sp. NLF-5-8]|nr:pseudouridine synthase [Sinimarinibacterium sp. NLF-5-8]
MKTVDVCRQPPIRDGVAASAVQLPPQPAGQPWPTLLAFLCARFGHIAPDQWQQRFADGLVMDDGGAALPMTHPYRVGQRIRYYRALPPEPPIPFEAHILHQDAHLLVADKPHFLPVTPTGRYVQQSLLVRLRRQTGLADLAPLHRLDRDTAGVVLFSVAPATRAAYQALFAQRRIDKVYRAIAPYRCLPDAGLVHCSRIARGEPFFRMAEVSGPPNSETRIRCLGTDAARACYELRPISGRKHQLRVHMAALGMPIENDPLYPQLRAVAADDYRHPLQLLAAELAFDDPISGRRRVFASMRQLNALKTPDASGA